MDTNRLLERLRSEPAFARHLVHVEAIAAAGGEFTNFPEWTHAALLEAYTSRGIARLYTHQREAVELAHAGATFVWVTPTASGKTLAYNLPALDAALRTGGAAKALYLFPTKALSQDQVAEVTRALSRVRGAGELRCFTYDGDTPAVRRALRERGNVVVTNPWMLHQGILPNHAKWIDLFRGLRYVVLDEVHTLGGVFGSHVANVLRRPRPRRATLRGEPNFHRVERHDRQRLRAPAPAHGARRRDRRARRLAARRKKFAIYNPPLLNAVAGLRGNAPRGGAEARRGPRVVGRGPESHQSIFFVRTRPQVEVLVKYLKDGAREHGRDPELIRGYRGGYLPELRREIERDLRSGVVKTVVSTNALELGIDVGRLDVAVLVGYPGTVASAWQQAGRAGRRGQPSLAVLIARNDAMDQCLATEPRYLFSAAREEVAIDPNNPVILANQIKCAAFELPFRGMNTNNSAKQYGAPEEDLRDVLDHLAEDAGLLHRDGDSYHWAADAFPAQDVSLEGEDADDVTIVEMETQKVLGVLARPAAIVEIV